MLCSGNTMAIPHLLQVHQNHEAWGMASNNTCEVIFVEVPNLAVIVPWIRMPFSYLDLKKLLFSPRFICFELPQPTSFNLQSGDGDFFGRIFDREVWDQLKDFLTKRAHVIFCSLPITPSQSESLKTLCVGFEKPSKTNKDDLIISWMNDDWTRSFVQHGFKLKHWRSKGLTPSRGTSSFLHTKHKLWKSEVCSNASFSGKFWRFSLPFPVYFSPKSSRGILRKKAEQKKHNYHHQYKQSLFRLSRYLSLACHHNSNRHPGLKGHCFLLRMTKFSCLSASATFSFFIWMGKVEGLDRFQAFFPRFWGLLFNCLLDIQGVQTTQICQNSPWNSGPRRITENFQDTVELPKVFLLLIGKVQLDADALVFFEDSGCVKKFEETDLGLRIVEVYLYCTFDLWKKTRSLLIQKLLIWNYDWKRWTTALQIAPTFC